MYQVVATTGTQEYNFCRRLNFINRIIGIIAVPAVYNNAWLHAMLLKIGRQCFLRFLIFVGFFWQWFIGKNNNRFALCRGKRHPLLGIGPLPATTKLPQISLENI